MKIGGLEKLSLIDYPGQLSAVVFTVGCTFRCPFCYNPLLVANIGKGQPFEKEEGLFLFLKERLGKLDGVVISGGEPTMHNDLPEFIKKIKDLGFKIKLDTNGTNPEMLKKLLAENLLDYIAMDIKADEANYDRVSGSKDYFPKVSESVKIIMMSKVSYEFRTTCVPGFLDKEIMENAGKMIVGADKWYLQKFKNDADEMIDNSLKGRPAFSNKEMQEFAEIGRKYVKFCEVRG